MIEQGLLESLSEEKQEAVFFVPILKRSISINVTAAEIDLLEQIYEEDRVVYCHIDTKSCCLAAEEGA
ncbi:hypothetical protein HCA69_15500 [Listeria grandensis]|uniref:Uncharacterized protein n=1 Tax=Listeria grandensis TaxID=1494963 RepID=A0A7X0Y758_9LIST|nr:hypothetical protein [Listeria grandensis]MBC1937774.1 hypothetical protein [Listeria grandensis]